MSSRSPLGQLGLRFVGGVIGAMIGVIVGGALYSGPTEVFDSGLESWWLGGAMIGFLAGAIALPLFVWWLEGLDNRRRQAKR